MIKLMPLKKLGCPGRKGEPPSCMFELDCIRAPSLCPSPLSMLVLHASRTPFYRTLLLMCAD